MYQSTYAKSGKRSYNSDRNRENDYRRSDSQPTYRSYTRENNSRDDENFGDYDSDSYENEFSRYDDGYDDNYSSPAYSTKSGNFNAGKRTGHDDRNFFERAGDRIREGWRSMVDDDDEDDYRNDYRNTRDDDEEDERHNGRYDRNYPDYRETNSYGRYDRRDTYGRENERVNSSRGYNGRVSSYGGYGVEGPRGYSNLGSEGRSYNNNRKYENDSGNRTNSYSKRNSGYGGYQNSSRKSYDTSDYNNHRNRTGREERAPYYNESRESRSDYYNSNKNGYGSSKRPSYGESWRNHFEW